ncbi:Mlp lipoprotein family protein (plasmid) [Borrelia crocidurae DOU]|uniref:Mlp lipoprotein family protein n=1 Tax=Borrelia crocidurae DOU TaxID=1293575 RepID=W5SK78_9SPIR|nr:Mlp family lipoprotein [Borrelia crocidurae]AHH07058.1 Mlp lipoprotein family protein [Borrelia crocidurae DOU]
MYKYLKHILFICLILIYSCTDKLKVHERINLTPTKRTPHIETQQTYETKNFNTIIHGFNKIIEILKEKIIEDEKKIIEDSKKIIEYEKKIIEDSKKIIEDEKKNITNYDQFISWIEKNPDKKKELDKAWTEAYNLLEQRRAENAPEKTLKEYIIDAIDCALNPTCQDTKEQYGTNENQIDVFFEQTLRDIFPDRSDPKEIFIKLQTPDISFIKDNF